MRYVGLIIAIGTVLILGGCGTAGKNFDTPKIETIANGVTTKTEIKKLLGKPFKTGIQNGQPIWVYEHHHYHLINQDTSKDLIIIFGPDGVVLSHQFMSSE